MLCCGYTLTDFPISIRLTSLALWQSNDCPSASKATLMNMDKHYMWIHYERLHNHNQAKHNKNVCIFLGIYCILWWCMISFIDYGLIFYCHFTRLLLKLRNAINNPNNYADPVYVVATICHQVRCLRWGHPSLFHTAMYLLIWYKMFCMRDISYRLIWMKYLNMLSVYAQSGTHRPFNWWIIAVFI